MSQVFLVERGGKSPAFMVHPVPARGACRPSRNVGRGERWARRVTRRVIWRARRNRVVLTPGMLASSPREASASRGRWWQEAPIHQGEHDICRRAIAQGRPDCLRRTCMLVCAFLVMHIAHETAGAARTRSSLRPLVLRRELTNLQSSGKACRENEKVCS